MMAPKTRRSFLKLAGANAAALSFSHALLADSPNDRVRLGLIGCGGRGRSFLDHVVAACDPDEQRLARAVESSNVESAHAFTDMRRMLDDSSIDAVIIATPDHWHAPAALLAIEAGKHVYVEKPCSHNFRESQLLLQAAQEKGLVVQHGTQQRSRAFIANAVQMLREGVIGDVLVAKAWNIQLRSNIGHAKPTQPPASVDYDTWLGPAEDVPYQKNRFHSDWHWWFNFGTGGIGNDGAHEMDYARWGLGVDTLPARISALGGKYFFDDDQQFPDTATCLFDYPADQQNDKNRQLIFEMRLWSRNYPYNCDSGVEYYGTAGKMFLSKRGKLQIWGPGNEVLKQVKDTAQRNQEHLDNFTNAIRSNGILNASMEEAHRSVAPIHLANIAVRLGRLLQFDREQETIVGNQEANRLLSRTYRQDGHWAVPAGV
jgi:predicted dehydrogenase